MFPYGEKLFHLGIGIVVIAVIFALVAGIFCAVSSRRLRRRLEMEYGKKRH